MDEMSIDCDAAPLGLFSKTENEILPLFSTEIKANIFGKFAKVQLIHNYYSPFYKSIQYLLVNTSSPYSS